jgi:signal peptidase I
VNSKSLPRAEIRSEGDIVIYKELNDQAAYEVAYGKKTPSTLPPPITVKVPPGHFFVLGDNRHHAADSRHFGLVPFEAIVGRKW